MKGKLKISNNKKESIDKIKLYVYVCYAYVRDTCALCVYVSERSVCLGVCVYAGEVHVCVRCMLCLYEYFTRVYQKHACEHAQGQSWVSPGIFP